MSGRKYTPEDLRTYLLGHMIASDLAQLEARRRADDELADAIDLAESLLIDAYIGQTLTDDETQSFQQNFLTTEDRETRLAMARGIQSINAQQARRRRLTIGVVLISTLALIVVIFWQRSLGPAVVHLAMNNTKGSVQPPMIRFSDSAETIILEFECATPPPAHTLTLGRIGEAQPVLTLQNPAQWTATVRLPIQTAMLPPGEYLAILSAGEEFRADFRLTIAP